MVRFSRKILGNTLRAIQNQVVINGINDSATCSAFDRPRQDSLPCRIRNMKAPQMIRRFNDLGFCTKLRQCIRSRNHWDNQDIFGSYPVVACVGRGNWTWVFVMVLYLHMMVQLFNRQTRLNHHFLQRKSEVMSPFKSSFWFK